MKNTRYLMMGTILVALFAFTAGCGGGSSKTENAPDPKDERNSPPPAGAPADFAVYIDEALGEDAEGDDANDPFIDPEYFNPDDGGDGGNFEDEGGGGGDGGEFADDGGGNQAPDDGGDAVDDDDVDEGGEDFADDDGFEDGDGHDDDEDFADNDEDADEDDFADDDGFEDGDGHDDDEDFADNDEDADMNDDGIGDNEDMDMDGDGFASGEDCDDDDPAIFPGAPDKPDYPGYVDSNCDGVDGDLQKAYWVAENGRNSNPGTIDRPLASIQRATDMARADPTDVRDVYVVEGSYDEDITLQSGVGIYGGYGPLNERNIRERSLVARTVRIDCKGRPLTIIGSARGLESVVEGLTINGASDQSAILVDGSSPQIRHNKIFAAQSRMISIAVFLKDSNAFLYDNTIVSADVSEDGPVSMSAAVFVNTSVGGDPVEPTLLGNTIKSGDASAASIGVYLIPSEASRASVVAIENVIKAGASDFLSGGMVIGYNVHTGGECDANFGATIRKNKIFGGKDSERTYGVMMCASELPVKIMNNFITGGQHAEVESTGIVLKNTHSVEVVNNTIDAGDSRGVAVSMILDESANPNVRRVIDNNILHTNGGTRSVGIFENARSSSPTSLRNNLFDNSLGTPYRDFNLGFLISAKDVNKLRDIAMVSGNIEGDAFFKAAGRLDYHLLPKSDAIDAGIRMDDVEGDIDGNVRPQGDSYDIGADEFVR